MVVVVVDSLLASSLVFFTFVVFDLGVSGLGFCFGGTAFAGLWVGL